MVLGAQGTFSSGIVAAFLVAALGCSAPRAGADRGLPAAVRPVASAPGPHARLLGNGEALVRFQVRGLAEPDGAPRYLQQRLRGLRGVRTVLYDAETGLWRVRYVMRLLNAEDIAARLVTLAAEDLAEQAKVDFLD